VDIVTTFVILATLKIMIDIDIDIDKVALISIPPAKIKNYKNDLVVEKLKPLTKSPLGNY